MFAVSASRVNSNPKTQAAIEQMKLKVPPTAEQLRRERELSERRKTVEERRRAAAERYFLQRFSYQNRPSNMDKRTERAHKMAYLADWICAMHQYTLRDLRSHRRDHRLVHARKAFCYWAKELTECSYPQIGDFLNRDHTTVLHAARTYRPNRKRDRDIIRNGRPLNTRWWRI